MTKQKENDQSASTWDTVKETAEKAFDTVKKTCHTVINAPAKLVNTAQETWRDLNAGNQLKKDLEQAKITGKSEHHADNYAHILTDAKIAQKGKTNAAIAFSIGVAKEVWDFTTKVAKGADFEETWNDCKKDMKNNLTGLSWGLKNPNADATAWMASLDLDTNTFKQGYDNGIARAQKDLALKADIKKQAATAQNQLKTTTTVARINQKNSPNKTATSAKEKASPLAKADAPKQTASIPLPVWQQSRNKERL